jgi:uncharacterized protein YggE
MITVNFTQQELQVLARLLDVATKAGGLAVAGDAFILFQKLSHAADKAKEVAEEKTEA